MSAFPLKLQELLCLVRKVGHYEAVSLKPQTTNPKAPKIHKLLFEVFAGCFPFASDEDSEN